MADLRGGIGLIGWFGAAVLGTAASVALMRWWAIRADLLDHPNHRSSHDVPTPRVGGVGIALVLLGGLTLLGLRTSSRAAALALLTTCVLGVVLAAVSVYDDIRSVAPRYRFLAHMSVAALVVAGLGSIDVIDAGALGRLTLASPWAELLTFLWVVSLINAVNFIDGIDGMAGAQAGVAGLGWVCLGAASASAELGVAGAVLAGTSVGFLLHNWNPARIFMGDGGSALLGFLLATLPWVLGGSQVWLASALMLWPALLDTSYTLVRRLAGGMPIWESHRMHVYQRLVVAGQAPSRVSAAYASASAGGLLVGILTLRAAPAAPVVAVLCVVAFVSWTALALRTPTAQAEGTTREG